MVSIRSNSPAENEAFPRVSLCDRPTRRADLPTMYDLPSEALEEPGLPDEYHDLQPQLLSRTLNLPQYSRSEWFTGSDLNLYYDDQHSQWYKRPDWFLSVGVSRLYDGKDLRRSYVVWQEGKAPDVVVEFLSEGTAAEDLGRFLDADVLQESGIENPERSAPSIAAGETAEVKEKPPRKLEVYEAYLRVPHYIVYDRDTQRLRYFQWMEGGYEERSLRPQSPLIWLADLGVGLGIWQGEFEEAQGEWLRWCDAAGNWLLTDTELERQAKELERQAKEEERQAKEEERRAKEQERQAKEQERQAKEQAELQVLQTARNLLASGMDLAQVTLICGLTAAQIERLRGGGF
ncbi:MAG: Uma2 family endonuclease [Oculatellaceae cyanobacterium Prado106]|jgi:Uma2 family endonuclease|nr:Uma2 family endonuclease [Oculatellaceae cyanobacterium Prado106]